MKANAKRSASLTRVFNKHKLLILVLLFGTIGTITLFATRAATPTASLEVEAGTKSANALVKADSSASGGSAIEFTAAPVVTPGTCQGAANTPGGSDPWGGCWPGAFNTGYPQGLAGDTRTPVTLTNYTGACTFSGNTVNVTLDKVDATGRCGALAVYNGAKLTIRNSKVPRLESTDDASPSRLGSIDVSDSTVVGGNWSDGALWGYNLTATRIVATGGQHNFHCNTNCTVVDSWLHSQYNPTGGSYHNNPFISNGGENMTLTHNTLHCTAILNATDGGCSGDLSLFGDFEPIKNVTAERNFLRANNSSISYCFYGGHAPGKPYPIATGIVFRNNVFERGANNRCGVYGPVTSFQTSAAGNIWSGNVWTDGTVLNPSD